MSQTNSNKSASPPRYDTRELAFLSGRTVECRIAKADPNVECNWKRRDRERLEV